MIRVRERDFEVESRRTQGCCQLPILAGSLVKRAVVADHHDDEVRCVGVDSCAIHDGVLVRWRLPKSIGRQPARSLLAPILSLLILEPRQICGGQCIHELIPSQAAPLRGDLGGDRRRVGIVCHDRDGFKEMRRPGFSVPPTRPTKSINGPFN